MLPFIFLLTSLFGLLGYYPANEIIYFVTALFVKHKDDRRGYRILRGGAQKGGALTFHCYFSSKIGQGNITIQNTI